MCVTKHNWPSDGIIIRNAITTYNWLNSILIGQYRDNYQKCVGKYYL